MYIVYDLHNHIHIHLRKMHLKSHTIYIKYCNDWEGMKPKIFRLEITHPITPSKSPLLPPNFIHILSY